MEPHERQDLVTLLDAGRDTFLNAVANLPNDLAGLSPGVGRWSVLQCVEHVAVAEAYLLSQVRIAKHSGIPILNRARETSIREKGSDRTRRVVSPDAGRPTGRFLSITDALQYFLACRNETIQFVENCNEDLRALRTDHPLIGPVNCHEMILMMAVHPRRHAAQIDEIRNAIR